MKTKLSLMALAASLLASACSFNIGTGPNASNTAATNAAPASTPSTAANAPATAANAAKSPEAAKPASKGADDPKSETEHIQFAKGTRESTLNRTIAPGVTKTYLLTAKKDQSLYFEVNEDTGGLEVDFNRRSVALGEHIQWQLNSSGDWSIFVSNPTNRTLSYKLFVGIDD